MENTDWKNLPFCYKDTDYNVRCYYRNGKWEKPQVTDSREVTLHMSATSLHYGQECFEGLKAFKGKDDKIRLFRWQHNAKRMQDSARGIMMVEVPDEVFKECVLLAIKNNLKYIPPYGSGATLYIRPLLIGITPKLGVRNSDEYLFIVYVNPVGPYFKNGFQPGEYMITRKYDRAAPLGTGKIKVGGNYAASLRSIEEAKERGFMSVIYLDAKEKKYIDESGHTNFFAIKGNKYITPESTSVLPSITNMSLMALAKEMGMEIERRKIAVDELAGFDEAGGCGTAAVISPISKIVDIDNKKEYVFCKDGKPGPVSTKLYERLTAIQFGDEEDTFNWITIVE